MALRYKRARIAESISLLGVMLCIFQVHYANAQGAPPGFVIENAFPTASFSRPVQIVFLPDGRKLVVEQGGRVWTMTSTGSQMGTPFIDLSTKVLSNTDRGLLGVALDPDFSTNRWVYFLYVVDPDSDDDDNNQSAFSRLERYKADSLNPNVADLSTRHILIGGSWPAGIPDPGTDASHTIGTLRFGRDKTLLVGNGDAAHFGTTDAGGLDPGAFGAGKTPASEDIGAFRSQSLNSLNGKILRIDKETGFGLSSNPYWDGNPTSARSRVWVYGLRNPFRFSIRPGTGSTNPADSLPGTLYIGDVGWNTTEELNIATRGGLNFGWPCKEGPFTQSSYSAVSSTAFPNSNVLCSSSLNSENPASKTSPALWWDHTNGANSNPVGLTGSASIGGVFYSGTTYPAEYQGRYFHADYTEHWIRAVQLDSINDIVSSSNFITGTAGPVDIERDPISGDLYYVGIDNGRVQRIRYVIGNHNPVVNATLTPTSGYAPLTVNASASGSTDPDGDSLSYRWSFGNGDSVSRADTSYTYNVVGTYTVTVTVADPHGGSGIAAFQVVVGQVPPVGSILYPFNPSLFHQNQTVPLEAVPVDTTQGPVTYRWDVDLAHNTHVHESQYILFGRTNLFPASVPDDGETYHLRIRLGVTQGALTTTDTAGIYPYLNLHMDSLRFNPSSPTPTSIFSAIAKIKSSGEIGTPPSTYEVREGATLLAAGSLSPVPHGDSVSVTVNIGPLSSGNHTLRFVVDPANTLFETNELDNEISSVVSVHPADVTSLGTPVALIMEPGGGGNHDIEVIRDGVFPPVGSGNSADQYDTYTGDTARAFDWIGYEFGSSKTFSGVTFQEGKHFFDGGWFTSLQVQVKVAGIWTNVQNLVSTPPYQGNNGINFETFDLTFTPQAGSGVRIAGVPGGSARFISVGELRALAEDSIPAVSSVALLTPNGGETWDYNTSHNIAWSFSNLSNVKIEYKTSPAAAWQTVVASTSASAGSYPWLIPNSPTSQARVRVSDVVDANPADTSDGFFTIAVASIATIPGSLNFGSLDLGSSQIDTVRIFNSGNGMLTVNISIDSTFFTPGRTSFSIPAGSSDTLSVRFSPPTASVFSDTLRISNNSPNSLLKIPLTGAGPLGIPALIAPLNGASNQPATVTLNWNSVLGAQFYRLQLSLDSLFSTTLVDDSTLTGTTRQVGLLANNATHYWRVRAKNAMSVSAWSPLWHFSTSSQVTNSYSFASSWNVISLPLTVSDARKSSVFPSSVSDAYSFSTSAGYISKDTLVNGVGYWLKFSSPSPVSITGQVRLRDTVHVVAGWNIVGAVTEATPTSAIQQVPPGIVSSSYYGYDGTFGSADTLFPAKGYWVKTSQNGLLIFDVSSAMPSRFWSSPSDLAKSRAPLYQKNIKK